MKYTRIALSAVVIMLLAMTSCSASESETTSFANNIPNLISMSDDNTNTSKSTEK